VSRVAASRLSTYSLYDGVGGRGLKFYFNKRLAKNDVMNTQTFRSKFPPPQKKNINRPQILEKYELRTVWGYKIFT